MTIKDYLRSLRTSQVIPSKPGGPSFEETMQEITEIWSNDACRGYFILAAQSAGLDRNAIQQVLDSFPAEFDEVSVDSAAKIFIRY